MNYKQLLLKYINHVGISEGTTFLGDHDRNAWNDSVEFTDEEWDVLQALDKVNYVKSFVAHSCSCHTRNAGACDVCKTLGCEVWDFNQIAVPIGEVSNFSETDEGVRFEIVYFCIGTKNCRATAHANDCPKWVE